MQLQFSYTYKGVALALISTILSGLQLQLYLKGSCSAILSGLQLQLYLKGVALALMWSAVAVILNRELLLL